MRLSDEDRHKKRKTDLSQSIKNQVEYLRNYVEILNQNSDERYRLEIYKIYSDDDCTGMNFARGGFRQMMLDIGSGLVDCIMVCMVFGDKTIRITHKYSDEFDYLFAEKLS